MLAIVMLERDEESSYTQAPIGTDDKAEGAAHEHDERFIPLTDVYCP